MKQDFKLKPLPGNNNSIALIDDDEISLLLIRKILEHRKAAEKILSLKSGHEALQYFKSNSNDVADLPTIILLDISMPLMNGWQFLAEFNKLKFTQHYAPAVFIISASASIDFEMLKAFPLVKSYIIKPVVPDKLMDMIEGVKINSRQGNSVVV